MSEILSQNTLAVDTKPYDRQLMQRIRVYFEREKPYLDSSLTLDDVADALRSNRSYVSRTINNGTGSGFYKFVNAYRIGHALELMHSPDAEKYTLEAIARLSGFHSMTIFYHVFRREKGCTPKEYIRGLFHF